MQLRKWTTLIALTGLVACGGKDTDDTAGDTSSGDDTADTAAAAEGFSVSGTIQDYNTNEVANGTGLCVSVVDPTGAIAGGKYEVLASTTANKDGTFTVNGIETASAFGILMLVTACDGDTTNVMYSASGIASSSYTGLGTGDSIDDRIAWVIQDGYGNTLDTDLATAGYVGDSLMTTGALIGYVDDAAGDALGDATVYCQKCGSDTYYWGVGDSTFADGAVANTETVASLGAKWLIPAAPIWTYYAAADGYDFESLLAGTMAGMAVFVSFSAL
jgi:hypothetical protein